MRRALVILVSALVAVVVPAVLIVDGVRLLANDWYVHAEYARPGFPDDPYGLTRSQRTDLATVGLRSIVPQEDRGVAVLREARLPDGTPAFTEREIVHMQDVRDLVSVLFYAHLAALGAIAVLAFLLSRRESTKRVVPRALLAGSILTLVGAVLIVGAMLVDFDAVFTSYHTTFFEGDTWLFATSDTLIRLYPETFWSDFAILIGVLTVVQAALLGAGSWWWLRRSRARSAAAPPVAQRVETAADEA